MVTICCTQGKPTTTEQAGAASDGPAWVAAPALPRVGCGALLVLSVYCLAVAQAHSKPERDGEASWHDGGNPGGVVTR